MLVTVLTPTYNRAHLLPNLYNTLCNQSNMNFIWMIVDDGSTDNTTKLINQIQKDKKFDILYFQKVNGGKHTALNYGISKVETPLLFIVDSDDWLPDNAISTIEEYYEKYHSYDNLCGFSFLRCYANGNINYGPFPIDEAIETYLEARINKNLGGDKAEVFYTSIIKKYRFPEFTGEKFYSEDGVWIRISGEFDMVHINKCIYFCEYLEGGLTRSGSKMKIKSPLGMMDRSRNFLLSKSKWIVKVKHSLLFLIYGMFAHLKAKTLWEQHPAPIFFLFTFPVAIFIHILWRNKYSK